MFFLQNAYLEKFLCFSCTVWLSLCFWSSMYLMISSFWKRGHPRLSYIWIWSMLNKIMKSAGREQSLLPLPDFSRKIEGDSARSVEYRTRFLQWREDVNCWPKYRKHALLLNKMVKIFPRFHTKMLKTRTSNSMRILSTIARIIAVLAPSTEPSLSCDKHWNLQVIQLDQKQLVLIY